MRLNVVDFGLDYFSNNHNLFEPPSVVRLSAKVHLQDHEFSVAVDVFRNLMTKSIKFY